MLLGYFDYSTLSFIILYYWYMLGSISLVVSRHTYIKQTRKFSSYRDASWFCNLIELHLSFTKNDATI